MYKWKFTVHVPKETGEIPSPQSLVMVLGSPGFETALALRRLLFVPSRPLEGETFKA